MANGDTFGTILAEIGKGLLPLSEAVSSPDRFIYVMQKLGWQADAIPQPLRDLGTSVETLFAALRKIVGDGLALDGSVSLDSDTAHPSVALDDVNAVAHAVAQVVNAIRNLENAPDAGFPATLVADGFKTKFPQQLIDFLLITYLTRYQSTWAFALRALGVIKKKSVPRTGNRLPFVQYSFDFSDLPNVFSSPTLVLQNAYGWGTDDFDFATFSSQVDNLLWHLGLDTSVEEIPLDVASMLEGGANVPGDPTRRAIKAIFFERARTTGRMSADARMLYLPAESGKKPGFVILPAFNGMMDFAFQLSPDIAVTITSDMDLQGGIGFLIRPNTGAEMLVGFNNNAVTHKSGSLQITVDRSQLDNTPTLLLGSPDSTRLQYQKLGGLLGIRLDANQSPDIFAEADLKGLSFVLSSAGADGFVQKIFPSGNPSMGFDLTAGISYKNGFYFRGTSHLEISVPAHIQLGPIDIQSLTISANPRDGTIPVSIGASFDAALGPLTASVDNIGLIATFSFPNGSGNLGPLNLSLGFKPPNGVGLSVDAGPVKGGGFLYIDTDRGEYAGTLQLVFSDFIGLSAIGLITTKLPDGTSGFSLLIIITADFGAGIQLGFGFTLSAVGGLLGLNRTMLFQPLMDGIRTNSIQSIMFPQDVANATRILSDLRAIFPPQEGTFLIGPMAKLGWGEPILISISLGVIIEIPPGDVAILGILKVALPADDIPVLVLQVNFAGALEFDKQRLYFFASLYDSHILFVTIEGEMDALVAYGADSSLIISVGGFHPQFNPPPLPIPVAKRIEVDIINESFARIRCSGYFAVTSNTVQFGSHSEYFFGFDALSLQGSSGFDALIQFSPFHFTAAISTSFSVNVFGLGVYGVDIDLVLEGPTPWHAHGTASLSFFFFSIGIGIDFTWGDNRNTSLPPAAVMPIAGDEFSKSTNWKAVLPAGSNLLVSLRKMSADQTAMVLHPVGTLRVSQRAVPLDLTLDKIGSQQPSDANRFAIDVTAGGLTKVQTLQEEFAPAQFRNMDDATKLSQPAYVPMDSGIELAAAGQVYASGTAITRNVRYDLTVVDTKFKRSFRRFFRFTQSLFVHFLAGSAVTQSAFSAFRANQMQPVTDKVKVSTEGFVIALQRSNQAFADAPRFSSQAAAQDFVARAVAQNPELDDTLHVLPHFEVAA
jgi:hypothetical protein